MAFFGGLRSARQGAILVHLMLLVVVAGAQDLPTYFRGQDAVDYLRNRTMSISLALPNQDKLLKALLRDGDLALVAGGELTEPVAVYSCRTYRPDRSGDMHPAVITPPNQPDEPIANAFALHSRPGAPRIIFLDFNGATVANDPFWNAAPHPNTFTMPAYDTDGTAGFSNQELTNIIAIWRAVAEDYAPFDVDVTTQDPGAGALDNGVGVHAIIGGAPADIAGQNCGTNNPTCTGVTGRARYNVFGVNNENRAFIFSVNCQGSISCVWDTISHEIGHTLNLFHDGCATSDPAHCDGTNALNVPDTEYYMGHNNNNWNSIMGLASSSRVSQWSRGEYANANQFQDDLGDIAALIPRMADVFGDSIATAHPLAGVATAAGAIVTGAIVRTADIDMFDAGQVAGKLYLGFNVVPDAFNGRGRANLDATVRVLDAAGTTVDTWTDSSALLRGTHTVNLPAAGRYYVSVEGVGQGTPSTDWSAYGSLGSYTLTIRADSIQCNDKVVQLPQAGTCVDAALPADAVTDASGVGYTLFPPGPYKPGMNTITVTPNDGGPTCTVTFNVLACPPIKCNGVTKSLTYGFCDDIAVPSGELWSGGPVGTKVSGFPTGPFIPGATKVTLTPTEPIGLESCTSTVTVIPCKAVCTDKTVNTDPGVCVASSVSIIDLKSVGKTALAAPDTTKQTPPAPYALGETSPVSVVVNYLGGLVSAASDPACRVTVRDVELPSVAAVKSCLYPKGHSYSKRTHCFPVPELATLADNCPNARLDVMSCKLVGSLPKHIKNKVVPCTVKPDAQSLCVSLDYLDHSTPRTIRAIVRGTDTSGNFAEAETTVKIYKKKPHTGRNKSCKLV